MIGTLTPFRCFCVENPGVHEMNIFVFIIEMFCMMVVDFDAIVVFILLYHEQTEKCLISFWVVTQNCIIML